jgi:putative ABC transport system permease protein
MAPEPPREPAGWRWIHEVAQDVRYAMRLCVRAPGFTCAAILILALGIGANTAVFSSVDAVLLRPLPYDAPDRLVAIWNRNTRESGPSKLFGGYGDFEEYGKSADSFASVAAATWAVDGQVLTGRGPTREILAVPVSASFFSTLGVRASLGRTFTAEDERRGCSVVLSDRFWRNTLGADHVAIGQSITLKPRSCTVLGVMAPGFSFYPDAAQMWILLGPDFRPSREQLPVGIFARLKPGVTSSQAQAQVTALHRGRHQNDGIARDLTPVVYDLKGEFTWLASRTLRSTLVALSGAVTCVLLIACLNVATLMLGRTMVRERELAIRAALGAGQRRLVRQLLTEGFLLSLAGSAVGVLLAAAAMSYFRHSHPIELPIGADVTLHWPTLLFSAALTIVTTLIFALVPAMRASHLDVNQGLKSDSRGSIGGASRGRLVCSLVTAETALSVTLLAGAGLLIQSVVRMSTEPLGFDPDDLLTMNLSLPADRYSDAASQLQFYEELDRRLAAVPGAPDVAFSWARDETRTLEIEGQPESGQRLVGTQVMTPASLRVLKVPLLRGRTFDDRDVPASDAVAVVNDAFAREYFPGVDPVGRRIRAGDTGKPGPWLTIVGVAGNVKTTSLYQEMSWKESPTVFRPLAQDLRRRIAVVVRTPGDLTGTGSALQRQIAAMDSTIPLDEVQTMNARLAEDLAYPRFRAVLFGAFAVSALLLAAVGLYGVLGQFVAQRRHEFAVRMAVGASKRHIVLLVTRHGGVPVIVGLITGTASALAVTRVLAGLLYGVGHAEPFTVAGMSAILLAVAALATAIPARRAATVDPMVALRDE